MLARNLDPERLRWNYNEQTDELYRLYDGVDAWAAILVYNRPSQLRSSGHIGRRITDAEAEEIVRRRSGWHPYCWEDDLASADHQVRMKVIAPR